MSVDKNQLMTAVFLKKQLDKFIKENKQDLEMVMEAGDSSSAKFDLDGQTLTLGKVTMTDPKYGWKVTDEDALAEWAEKNMPNIGETRFILSKPGVEDLLREVTERNGAFTDEGELIPGVEWTTTSNPYLRIAPDRKFEELFTLIGNEGRLGELVFKPLGIESDESDS